MTVVSFAAARYSSFLFGEQTIQSQKYLCSQLGGKPHKVGPHQGGHSCRTQDGKLVIMHVITVTFTGTSMVSFKRTAISCKWSVNISFNFKTKPVTA